jgi:hypothetical protein
VSSASVGDAHEQVAGRLTAVAGILFIAGGALHPAVTRHVSFARHTANMLARGTWLPSHSLLLVSLIVLGGGLARLRRSCGDDARLEAVVLVAMAAIGLGALELVFHLAAKVERADLLAGRHVPIVATHEALAVVAYPIYGIALAAVAVELARTKGGIFRSVALLGIAGGILHGIAAPLVVLSRDQDLSFLFKGAVLLGIWMVIAGAALARRRREDPGVFTDVEAARRATR